MKLSELEEIYLRCLECPPDERARIVDEISIRDPVSAGVLRKMLDTTSVPEPCVRWSPSDPAKESGPDADGSESSFPVGSVLNGRYRIDGFVAAGGMGQVYRAYDLELDSELALKSIRARIAGDPVFLDRFRQEVLLSRAVKHPNVCQVYDLGRDEASGTTFLTMKFLEGETLAQRIRVAGRLHPTVCRWLVGEVAAALDAAHAAGVVHRDFKPQNVIVTPNGKTERAVVTDFGLAAPIHTASGTRSESGSGSVSGSGSESGSESESGSGSETTAKWEGIAGTPAYISPEHAQGEAAGPSSDIYSLGIVLYEMCTGRVPFLEDTPTETVRAQVERTPPPPSTVVDLEPGWEDVILRALSKNPTHRFATAGEMAASLKPRSTTVASSTTGLPALTDAFVGRRKEIGFLRQLEGPVWLTLVGIPGVGKSRLAREFASEITDVAAESVRYVNLRTPASRDPKGHVLASCRRALTEPSNAPIRLLILDGLDGIPAASCAEIRNWAGTDNPSTGNPDNADADADTDSTNTDGSHANTNTIFLATSRSELGLPGERVLHVPLLDPATQGLQLLEERFRSKLSPGQPSEVDREALQRIAQELDGIPLALELAAERLGLMSPQQLLARLDPPARVLSGSSRSARDLHSVFLSWWNELPAGDQEALRRVCGLSLPAAAREAVKTLEEVISEGHAATAEEDDSQQPDVAREVVRRLVAGSWLYVEERSGLRSGTKDDDSWINDRIGIVATVRRYITDVFAPPKS